MVARLCPASEEEGSGVDEGKCEEDGNWEVAVRLWHVGEEEGSDTDGGEREEDDVREVAAGCGL